MSKSTKVIAALGVAAGLGVAALPAATFADSTTYTVPLAVNINESLNLEGTTTGEFASNAGVTLAAGESDLNSKTVFTANYNKAGGWKVTVAGTNDAAQQSGSTLWNNATSGQGQSIAPFASGKSYTPAEGKIVLGDGDPSGWGITVTDVADDVTTGTGYSATAYTGITANAVVASTSTTGNAGKSFTVNYGVALADGQAAGNYKGNLTYTLEANN